MSNQTNARDIPCRKEDVDAVTAAIEVLGVAGLALEAGGNLEAVKDALEAGGYSGSRLNTIANALTSGGYSASRLNDIKASLEAGGALYVLTQALEALLTTIGTDTSRIPANPATEDGNLASILAKIIAAPATEAKQDDQIANQGKAPLVEVNFAAAANYAGTQITCTETLQVSMRYLINDAYATLTGGTGGNTTQPGFSGTTGFSQDTDSESWAMSAACTVGASEMQHDVLGMVGPAIKSDANGKVYMKGAAPGAADSTLSGKLILREARSGS